MSGVTRATHKPYRRRGRPHWWATVYDEAGRRRRVMVATDDQGYEAAVVARAKMVDRARLISEGLTTRREVDAADVRHRTIRDCLDEMLADPLLMRRSAAYRAEIESWIGQLAGRPGVRTLADLSSRNVRAWLRDILERGLSASSHNHALARVRRFWRWCHDRSLVAGDDPTHGITALNEAADARQAARALSVAELDALLRACPDPLRRLRYLLGARQGLRQEECDRLCWRHLDLDQGWVRLDAALTKSKRADDLPMSDEVRAAASAIRPPDAGPNTRIFAGPMRRPTWLRDLRRAGLIVIKSSAEGRMAQPQDAGATFDRYRDDRGRVLSLQSLRKTYGTHLASVEPNVARVAKLMRHTDPRLTLALYQDARLLDLGAAQKALPPVGGASAVPVKPLQDATVRPTSPQASTRKNTRIA